MLSHTSRGFTVPSIDTNCPNESGVQHTWRLFLLAGEVLKLATAETVARKQMMHVSKNT